MAEEKGGSAKELKDKMERELCKWRWEEGLKEQRRKGQKRKNSYVLCTCTNFLMNFDHYVLEKLVNIKNEKENFYKDFIDVQKESIFIFWVTEFT